MNCATLSGRVYDYLDYALSDTKIIGWINDTRRDLALKYDFNYLYEEATVSTEAGSARYALPSDYLGHLTIFCDNKKLERIGAREFDSLGETDSTAVNFNAVLPTESSITDGYGSPDYYIDRGMEIDLYPIPGAIYTLTLKYYAQPVDWDLTNYTAATLSGASDYISTFHPEAIIFGAALRGSMYLDDEQKKANYGAAYDAAIKEMINNEKFKIGADKRPRMKTWKDFDLRTFKRMTRMNS